MNVQDWREIRQLHEDGMPIKAIARHRGISRNTVRRALQLGEPPEPPRARGSVADAREPEIRALLAADPAITVAAIAERLGWEHSMTVLKDRVRTLRAEAQAPAPPGPRTELPAQLTEFVGREAELASIREVLGSARLVTLLGPGGVGKTRLAIQAADKVRRAFADGVRWVELGALQDPALLAQTLVDALGIRDRSARPQQLLDDYLHNRQLLLVLDNCEHLLTACAELASHLLHGARELRIIATSREALAIPGEHAVTVAPLRDNAVTLFAARARDILPGFSLEDGNLPLVRTICTQLDGLPLAIELACARLRVLSLAELADRLGHRLRLLTGGNRAAPERHRSLQATVDWSFELCDPVERRLWIRTSVFAGSFALKAAEEVCQDARLSADDIVDGIDGLVGKSLLLREEHHGQVRFRMLETLREYGQAKLNDMQAAELRIRHHAYYARMIGDVTKQWFGERQHQWCVDLRLEHANLRTAFETALARGDDGTRLIGAPWFLWAAGFSFTEHRYWLERALDAEREPSPDRARALATLGLVAALQGDRAAASRALAEGTEEAEAAGDAFGLAYNRHEQGLVAFFGGDFDSSERILLEALDRYQGTEAPPDLVGSLRVHLGLLYIFAGDTHEALRHFEALRPQCEEHGERWMLSYAVYGLGLTALMCGNHDEAVTHALESLRMKRPFDDTIGLSLTTDLLAWSEAARGEAERAAVLLGAAETLWASVGMQLYGSAHWLDQRTRFERRARNGLGDKGYEAAVKRGQALSRGQVLEFALGERAGVNRARPGGPELSRREAEVAELVADGLTNREIAQKLVISHRTVEGHVEHILDKLGLSRRAQVAQWRKAGG